MDFHRSFTVEVDWTFGAERNWVIQDADAVVLADREDVEEPEDDEWQSA